MRRHYQPPHSSPPASLRALPVHRGRNPSPLLEAHTHGPLRLATRTTKRMRSVRADPLPSPNPPYSAPSTPRASCSHPAVPARRAHLAYPKHDTYFHWCPQHLQPAFPIAHVCLGASPHIVTDFSSMYCLSLSPDYYPRKNAQDADEAHHHHAQPTTPLSTDGATRPSPRSYLSPSDPVAQHQCLSCTGTSDFDAPHRPHVGAVQHHWRCALRLPAHHNILRPPFSEHAPGRFASTPRTTLVGRPCSTRCPLLVPRSSTSRLPHPCPHYPRTTA
jgi:hypothetical protein